MEKQKILIVDDSEMNRALLVDILDDQYDVVEAENGTEAVSILSQHRTDCYRIETTPLPPEGRQRTAVYERCVNSPKEALTCDNLSCMISGNPQSGGIK